MIEFEDVEPDEDGLDEELPQGRERRLPGTPRVRRAVSVVAALLVGGGIVTYAQLSGSPEHRPTAQTSSSVPESVPAVPSGTSASGGLLIEHLGDRHTQRNDLEVSIPARLVAPACPQASDGFASCVVHQGVPSAFAAAIRDHYPQARRATASTAVLRASEPLSKPGLWSRRYRAVIDRATLAVLVTRNASNGSTVPATVYTGQTVVTYLRADDGPYQVEILARSPRGAQLLQSGLLALAADTRLFRA